MRSAKPCGVPEYELDRALRRLASVFSRTSVAGSPVSAPTSDWSLVWTEFVSSAGIAVWLRSRTSDGFHPRARHLIDLRRMPPGPAGRLLPMVVFRHSPVLPGKPGQLVFPLRVRDKLTASILGFPWM